MLCQAPVARQDNGLYKASFAEPNVFPHVLQSTARQRAPAEVRICYSQCPVVWQTFAFSSPHAQQHHLIRQARVQAASHSAHSEQTATMTVMTPRVIKAAVMDSAGVSASPLLPVSVADECVFSVKSR